MIGIKIEGLKDVSRALGSASRKYGGRSGNPSVIVGFTQKYALKVHEDLKTPHRVGQAKYLEQPARELEKELRQLIAAAMKAKATLSKALLVAGLRIQREAQLLVPVDTGALRASAFTRYEKK